MSGDPCGAIRLDLAFGDKALRYICESQAKARKEIGREATDALHARLLDLEAAESLMDLSWLPMNFGSASASIQFHPEYRLLVEPNEAKPPMNGGNIDWEKVDRLLLKRLERV